MADVFYFPHREYFRPALLNGTVEFCFPTRHQVSVVNMGTLPIAATLVAIWDGYLMGEHSHAQKLIQAQKQGLLTLSQKVDNTISAFELRVSRLEQVHTPGKNDRVVAVEGVPHRVAKTEVLKLNLR